MHFLLLSRAFFTDGFKSGQTKSIATIMKSSNNKTNLIAMTEEVVTVHITP